MTVLGVFVKNDKLGSPRMTLILQGPPCSYGKCTFCPFAVEQSIHVKDIIRTNKAILQDARKLIKDKGIDPERISIFNGGSLTELPLETIHELSTLTKGKIVDVELIPTLIKPDLLFSIKNILGSKLLVVRTGFEVFDENIRFKLGKEFPNELLYYIHDNLKRLHSMGIKVISYVLFGIDGVVEDKVRESVEKFKELLDGVICVRYRRYGPHMPRETTVSASLKNYLDNQCMLVDWTDNEEWVFQKRYRKTEKQVTISRPAKPLGQRRAT